MLQLLMRGKFLPWFCAVNKFCVNIWNPTIFSWYLGVHSASLLCLTMQEIRERSLATCESLHPLGNIFSRFNLRLNRILSFQRKQTKDFLWFSPWVKNASKIRFIGFRMLTNCSGIRYLRPPIQFPCTAARKAFFSLPPWLITGLLSDLLFSFARHVVADPRRSHPLGVLVKN